MPKRILKKISPDHEKLKANKNLRMFERWFNQPILWAMNRHSTPKAFMVGMFFAWIPMPFQMIAAAAAAIMINANIPISVVLVWFTNPLTMPIMFYGAYLIGAKLMGITETVSEFHATWEWLSQSMETVGHPFLVGCLFLATTSAVVSYFGISIFWRLLVLKRWKDRKKTRQNR